MGLKWERDSEDFSTDLNLLSSGKLAGWVRPHPSEGYSVFLSSTIAPQTMPCEEAKYVTLLEAMRTAKAIVTVLLIGRGYGP